MHRRAFLAAFAAAAVPVTASTATTFDVVEGAGFGAIRAFGRIADGARVKTGPRLTDPPSLGNPATPD